jgi:hypothetical protein
MKRDATLNAFHPLATAFYTFWGKTSFHNFLLSRLHLKVNFYCSPINMEIQYWVPLENGLNPEKKLRF